ncbi:MAG: hypothetical protein ACJ75B_03000 [Flavisolibacter sp.]
MTVNIQDSFLISASPMQNASPFYKNRVLKRTLEGLKNRQYRTVCPWFQHLREEELGWENCGKICQQWDELASCRGMVSEN